MGDDLGTTQSLGPNEWLVDEMYEQYLADPKSVSASWQEFFADYRRDQHEPVARPPEPPQAAAPASPDTATATTATTAMAAPRPAPPASKATPDGAAMAHPGSCITSTSASASRSTSRRATARARCSFP